MSERTDLLELDLPGSFRAAADGDAGREESPRAPAVRAPSDGYCSCGSKRPQQFRSETDRVRACPECMLPRRARPAAERDHRSVAVVTQESEQIAAQLGTTTTLSTRTEQLTRTSTPLAQTVVTVVEPESAPALRAGDLIAGAAAEGHGVLLGFSGRGTMSRGHLISILTGAGFPESWAPAATSAHRHAGRVVGALNSQSLIARADRSKSMTRTSTNPSAPLPTWQARWTVQRATRSGDVGKASGVCVLVVTLTDTGRLEISTSDAQLGERVRDDYEALVAGEIYSASDVSDWLKRTLHQRMRAAKLGGNWYVRRSNAAAAERLLTAFSLSWGENFLLPALPVASSEQLLTGIARSFERDVAEVLADYREKSDAAKAERKLMTDRASRSHLAKLRELTERCVGYNALLGPKHVAPLRALIVAAAEEIEQTIDGLSVRFGLIFDELRLEAERAATE